MKTTSLAALIILLTLAGARSATLAQWNFNSPTPDTNAATGSLSPSLGNGTASMVGSATSGFATGDTAAGHDPAGSTDNSAWETKGYPPATSNNKSAGVRFDVSTAGYENLSLSWYQRNTTTASRYVRLQYTADGSTFTDAAVITNATDSVFIKQTADLSALAVLTNNPAFGFRLVTEFESTATGSGSDAYLATKDGSTYGTAGAIRFDMVTVSGTAIFDGNTPPYIFASIADQTLRPNQSSSPLPFLVLDAESPATNLAVSAVCSNPDVLPVSNVGFGGSGPNRTVTVTAGNQAGFARVTVYVADPGGKSNSLSFAVTVLPGNTAPVISGIPRTNTLVNVPVAGIPFTVGDAETPATALAVSASSANPLLVPNHSNAIAFGGSGSNRSLTLTPAAGQTGVAPITVTVSDGTNTASSVFALMVVPSPATLFYDPFTYADGSLLTNSGFLWDNRSGTYGQCQATNGQLAACASRTEDVLGYLLGGPYAKTNGTVLYAGFRAKFLTLPAYLPGCFAHFTLGSTLRARISAGTSNAASGFFRLYVANGSDTNSALAWNLSTNVTYTLVTRYAVDSPATTLWLNPASESDSGVAASDVVAASSIASYGFREDSDIGADILIDDLRVGLSFAAVVPGSSAAAIPLSIQRYGNSVVLSWTNSAFGLQIAPSAGGGFTNVPGSASPFTNSIAGPARFFRLQAN